MIQYAQPKRTLLLCDFKGFIEPEMSKKRPVIVIANNGYRLCTIVPLSTSTPREVKPWHYLLTTENPLPAPYDSHTHWVKADMISTVSYERLFLPHRGKDASGKRVYDIRQISKEDFENILNCIAHAILPKCIDSE